MSNPEFTAPNFNTQTATAYKTNLDAAIAASGPFTNLGFSLSAGTFTVHGHEGTTLASTNPAFVRFQDPDNFGRNKYISVESNQDFIDDAGASEIINNLFGRTTGDATTGDITFYLYAVSNDAMDTVAFMISRDSGARLSPAVGNIGAPDDAVADSFTDFFSLDSLDETLYDTNPCVVVGKFRMRMSASDDWTVQALGGQDGIGHVAVDECHPAFLVGLNTSQSNVTGDGTVQTVNWDTAIQDHGELFDITTNYQFTAPISGLYRFSSMVYIDDIDGGDTRIRIRAISSNRTYQVTHDAIRDVNGDASACIDTLADMDEGDTIYIDVYVAGSGTKTADFLGNGSSGSTYFSGELVRRF